LSPTIHNPQSAIHNLPRVLWYWTALLLAALIIALPAQWRGPQRVEVGAGGVDAAASAAALAGFSFPETADGVGYRWSEGQAIVRFAGISNRPMTLRMFLHARRPGAPAPVTVLVNGETIATFPGNGGFTEKTFSVDRRAVAWDGNVFVAIRTQPFTAPPDTRQLGAAVAWVELAPAGGPAIPPLTAYLPLVLAVAGVLWGAGRGMPIRNHKEHGELKEQRALSSLWSVRSLWLLLAVVLGIAGAALLDRLLAWVVRWGWMVAAGVWAAAVIVVWGPRIVRRLWAALTRLRVRRPVLFWISLMTAAALAIYLPLCLTWGYRGDIEIYMAWTYQITHFGIQSAYSPASASPPNTTPGLLYFFWVAGEAFRHFFSPTFPPTWLDRTNQAYLRYFLRIPALLCNALIALIVYRLMRRRYGQRAALLAVVAYLFNPAVVFESAYYGQTGAVHSLFMLVGVVGLAEGRPAWGWAGLTAGMLTKPQADLFLPLFVVLTAQRYGWRGLARSAAAALGVGLVMLAPFLIHGTIGEMWARISRVTDYHPMLSATAHNFWWFASLGNGKASDLLMPPLLDRLGWPIFTYRWIGLGLVGLAYLLVLARVWWDRSARGLYLAAAYLFLAFFMLATQIHENHLIPMFSLLLLALPGDRRMKFVYAAFAVTATLNMALHYPEILRVLVPQNPDVWGGPELALPRWLDSAAQMAVFVYWTVIFVRETAAGLPAFGKRGVGENIHHAQTSSTPTLTADPATRSGNTSPANAGHAAKSGFTNV
jgi:hypothetical protein